MESKLFQERGSNQKDGKIEDVSLPVPNITRDIQLHAQVLQMNKAVQVSWQFRPLNHTSK